MINLPSLPLEGEPDGNTIFFREVASGRVRAYVYDDYQMLIDVVTGVDFEDAYNNVRVEYPQASWENPDDGNEEDQ